MLIEIKRSKYINDCNRELKYRFILCKINAKKRGYSWKLSFARFKMLLSLECLYCGGTVTGLDRVDNLIGYTKANSVPCCGECNQLKASLGIIEFIIRYKERLAKKYLINKVITA